jgi:hypothetical protein
MTRRPFYKRLLDWWLNLDGLNRMKFILELVGPIIAIAAVCQYRNTNLLTQRTTEAEIVPVTIKCLDQYTDKPVPLAPDAMLTIVFRNTSSTCGSNLAVTIENGCPRERGGIQPLGWYQRDYGNLWWAD